VQAFGARGWELAFVPEAVATHFGGGSTANAPLRYSVEMLRANLRYWRKHHGPLGGAVCWTRLAVHHGGRLGVRLVRRILAADVSPEAQHKVKEDAACLRWLLTGRVQAQ
jgi:GT2 family glycosyltransferase